MITNCRIAVEALAVYYYIELKRIEHSGVMYKMMYKSIVGMSYITVTTQILIQDILKVKKSHVALWKSGLDSGIITQCNRRGTVSLMLVAKEDALPSNCCYANVYTKSMIISVYYRLQAFIWYIMSYDNQLQHGSRGLGSVLQHRNKMHGAIWGHVQYDVKKHSGNELYYCYHSISYSGHLEG